MSRRYFGPCHSGLAVGFRRSLRSGMATSAARAGVMGPRLVDHYPGGPATEYRRRSGDDQRELS